MALTKLTKDMDIIQKLGDEPNDVDGLSAAELKAKFDEGNNAMKQWVNDTFIPEVENEIKASRLENLPEHAHTHAKDGIDPITPASIGARPDTWMPTASDVGAAPGGKGYGDQMEYVEVSNEAALEAKLDEMLSGMTVRTSKQFVLVFNSVSNLNSFAELAYTSEYGGGYATLTVYSWHISGDGDRTALNSTYIKVKRYGSWATFEWQNPPMQLGVEYRTTERHNGLPVYAKRIAFTPSTDFNANTTLAIPHGIDGYYTFKRLFARSGNYPLPFYAHEGGGTFTAVRSVDATNIYISSNQNWGKAAWTIDIFYPKD